MTNKRKYSYHKDGTLPDITGDYIFVFGSNLRGIHGRGAALIAKKMFGAEYGVGVGYTGRSYAIPTKDYFIKTLALINIKQSIQSFSEFTNDHPNLRFWVTGVACGLAGYNFHEISPCFKDCNVNCNFPEHWSKYLEPTNHET